MFQTTNQKIIWLCNSWRVDTAFKHVATCLVDSTSVQPATGLLSFKTCSSLLHFIRTLSTASVSPCTFRACEDPLNQALHKFPGVWTHQVGYPQNPVSHVWYTLKNEGTLILERPTRAHFWLQVFRGQDSLWTMLRGRGDWEGKFCYREGKISPGLLPVAPLPCQIHLGGNWINM